MKILSIEDNPGDVRLIREMLLDGESAGFRLECVDRLQPGLERLERGGTDLVLLDLNLPDSRGMETLKRVLSRVTDVPVIVMTGISDVRMGTMAVQEGAQDYLVKGQVDVGLLSRSIRYAVERQRLMAELRTLSLVDELTGLYNRRGFVTLAEQQMRVARRTGRKMLLFFIDIDGLKRINDTLGHQRGDTVLADVAGVLRGTFRESDIVARIGGDEFVALQLETEEGVAERLASRLETNLRALNGKRDTDEALSLSMGIAEYDPAHPRSTDELLGQADGMMYEEKRKNKARLADIHSIPSYR